MIHTYYSNTNIESFKKKFHEVVEISNGIFHSYSPLTGGIHGNSFEVRSGYPGSGKFGLFKPVINGTVHSRGQRTMVCITLRLCTLGVVTNISLIIMGIGFFLSSLLSDDSDSGIRRVVAGILVPAIFWLMGFYHYSSKSKELIRDLTDKLDLERE